MVTVDYASKYYELSVALASAEPARVCAHVRVPSEYGYSSVFPAHVGAAPMTRNYDHGHVHDLVHEPAVRHHARVKAISIATTIEHHQ